MGILNHGILEASAPSSRPRTLGQFHHPAAPRRVKNPSRPRKHRNWNLEDVGKLPGNIICLSFLPRLYIYMIIWLYMYSYMHIYIIIYIVPPPLVSVLFLVFTGFCDWFTWLEFFSSFESGYHVYIILYIYIVIVWWQQFLVWLDL